MGGWVGRLVGWLALWSEVYSTFSSTIRGVLIWGQPSGSVPERNTGEHLFLLLGSELIERDRGCWLCMSFFRGGLILGR